MTDCKWSKTCDWNNKPAKSKKHVKNYARYTMLNNFICFTLGHMTLL